MASTTTFSTASSPTKTPLAPRDPNTTSPRKSKSERTSDEKLNSTKAQHEAFQVPEQKLASSTQSEQQQTVAPRPLTQERFAAEMGKQDPENATMNNKAATTYISPSDTIMSPCTAKLNAYKGKRFATAKPQQSLFAKMAAAKKASSMSATPTTEPNTEKAEDLEAKDAEKQ